MADLRRWIQTAAVLLLVTGAISPASAQQVGLQCAANSAVAPTLRAEGLTELVGDVVLTCTGGTPTPAGVAVPQTDVTFNLSGPITSRVLGSATEALLLIDDPGPSNQTVCPTPAAGCSVNGTGGIASFNSPGLPNVYQGILSQSNPFVIIFHGVPVEPPVPGGAARTFRITNIRTNASTFAVSPTGLTPVPSAVSFSATVPITTPQQYVGYVAHGLNFTATSLETWSVCQGQTPAPVGNITFLEDFATAFKTRANNPQNQPGYVYSTESGLIVTTPSGTTGVADFGTRFTATLSSLPSGFSVYVDRASSSGAGGRAVLLGTSATSPDSGVYGLPPDPGNGQALVSDGSITAVTVVWEVISANPAAIDSFTFEIYIGPPISSTSAGGVATVTGSFAPTFAGTPSTIPAFVPSSNPTTNIFSLTPCEPTNYTISGQVTLSGGGLGGVTMMLTGSQITSATTKGAGVYSFEVAAGGNYTVTPSLAGYTFSPPNQTFNDLSANATANFIASKVVTVVPAVTIQKSHTGNFTQGQQNATYTLTVSNASGAGTTSGQVTVTETVPSGLTLVSMAGTGWTCPSGNTCTRSDALAGGANYPAITVTVNVAATATSPQVNSVSVSGGGSANASATDSTTINPSGPVISSVVNAAGFQPSVVPGSLVTIIGTGMAPQGPVSGPSSGPLPYTLGGVSVSFTAGGSPVAAPISSIASQNGQDSVTVQAPFELTPGSTTVSVTTGGATATSSATVAAYLPGIFQTVQSDGVTRAIVQRPDGSFVSPSNPAMAGEIVTMQVTGLGQVSPAAATDEVGVAGQNVAASLVVGVNNGGVLVESAVYSVGEIGRYTLAFQIPQSEATGINMPLAIAVYNGQNVVFGNPSLISIQPYVPPPPPSKVSGATIAPMPSSPAADTQPQVQLAITNPYASALTGQLALSFTSSAVNPMDDPTIQFSGGGRTVDFTIAANSTNAVFSGNAASVGFQTGTTEGTITLTASFQTNGVDVTPSSAPTQVVHIGPEVPVISSATKTITSSSINVEIKGFSTTRDLTKAVFNFSGTSNLQTPSLTVDLNNTATMSTTATAWFQGAGSAQWGGMFDYTQTFSVQGNTSDIESITVTVTNSQGTSLVTSVN